MCPGDWGYIVNMNLSIISKLGSRELPTNIEAEQCLLGAILLKNEIYLKVRGFLRPEHFANGVHSRIYAAAAKAIENGQPATPTTLKSAFETEEDITRIGMTAIEYLRGIAGSAVTFVNAPWYAQSIVDCSDRRQIIDIATAIGDAAYTQDTPVDDIIPRALSRLQLHSPTVELTCAADLADTTPPPRPWLIKDWIPRRQVTLLSGDGGGGKSQIALQLQVAAAAGMPWLGLDVEQCRSVGFYAEDEEDELHRRLYGIIELTGVRGSELKNMYWKSVVGSESDLIEIDETGAVQATAYFHHIERAAVDLGARLVILDAVTNFFGGDEIRRRQVNSFLTLLRKMAIKIDGAVLLLAHPSAQGISTGSGLSGSTHWSNAVRSRLYLTRPKGNGGDDTDPDERHVTRMKANYAGIGDVLRIKWQPCGFVPLDAPSGVERTALNAKADRVFLSLLAATYAEGTWTSPNPSARNYAPSQFSKRPDREGIGKPALEAAMHRLTKTGQIKIETYGRPSDPHSRFTLA